MLNRFVKIGLIAFFCLWALVILVEYYFQNFWHIQAITNFQYQGWALIVLALGIGASYAWYKLKPKPTSLKFLNGLTVFALSWLVVLIVSAFYASKIEIVTMGGAGAGKLTGMYLSTTLATYFIFWVCYALGDIILQVFPLPLQGITKSILTLGVGLIVFVTLIFLLASVHLLTAWTVFPLCGLILLINIPGSRTFLRNTLWKPLPLAADLNAVGIFSFWLVLIFASLNYVQIIRPIPIGADAMALYMRIPSLIHDYQGLVQGYSVYNWSLLMSLGFVMYNKITVVLALGYIGGILSIFALYALCRRWLNTNHALLTVLIFYSMPMVSFHSYQDMKIDLGMLFISLCIVLLLANWIKPSEIAAPEPAEEADNPPIALPEANPKTPVAKKPKSKKRPPQGKVRRKKKLDRKQKKRSITLLPVDFWSNLGQKLQRKIPGFLQGQALVIWIALFTGFALGTKLTTLFIFFPLIIVLWYIRGNVRLMLGTLCLSLFVLLFLGLDGQAGLRKFHLDVEYSQWALAAIGLLLLIWETVRNPALVLNKVKMTLIFGFFFVLPVSPWLMKNYSETHEISRNALLSGQSALPKINLQILERNFNQQQKQEVKP